MGLFKTIKGMFAWNSIVGFLKEVFKGILLLIVQGAKDLAVEAAREVATKGLPDDEAKRKEFERIMREKAQAKGMEIGTLALNLLRELAVAYLKNKGIIS